MLPLRDRGRRHGTGPDDADLHLVLLDQPLGQPAHVKGQLSYPVCEVIHRGSHHIPTLILVEIQDDREPLHDVRNTVGERLG